MLHVKQKQKNCEELKFLKNFISSSFTEDINKNPKYELSLIEEPFTGLGYPDLVCVLWDKKIYSKWINEREKLKIQDIKILHHLYNKKKYTNITTLSIELGFSKKSLHSSIKKLLTAKTIIENKNNKFKIKPIDEIFFVKDIISIEAKLHDWNKALEQSINNTFFSSKSFTLFPDKIISQKLLDKYSSTEVGIISFDKKYSIIQKPTKQKIPSTLNSWFFNEYIGREFTCSQ